MKNPRWFIIFLLLPAFLLYTLLVVVPGVTGLLLSLTDFDGITPPRFVGLYNFQKLLGGSEAFLAGLKNNLFIVLVPGLLTMAMGLFFAVVIDQRVRGAKLFRVTFFFPNVIPSAAVALLWILIYSSTDVGLLNHILGWLGLGKLPWLDSSYLYYSMIPILIWGGAGSMMIFYLAGMAAIPPSLYEAAQLDGATPSQQFRYVTLPLLRNILAMTFVFTLIGGLKFFDLVWIMENGYPTRDTQTLGTLLYTWAFRGLQVGYAAAIGVLLFVIILACVLGGMRLFGQEGIEY
jgi:ABC-type sugar transport system permease subunit